MNEILVLMNDPRFLSFSISCALCFFFTFAAQDVRLSVPMDSARCVEKVKEALDIVGTFLVKLALGHGGLKP